MKSLVSTVIIFLNEEKFIEEAIESVFGQTYDNWELLLVDDGSNDGSSVIALEYAQQYPDKVRYLEHDDHQNKGMSASRNLGVRNASGGYIAFLDADDVWLPHKLEQQVTIMDALPEAGMVLGASQLWSSWTGSPEDIGRDVTVLVGGPPNKLVQPPKLLSVVYPLGKGEGASISGLMVRREVIDRVNGFEESFRGMYEDQVFFAKVYLKVPVFISSALWDRYRLRPDSHCSAAIKAGQYHAVRRYFLNWFAKYLSAQEGVGTEAWKALENALWPYRHPILFRLLETPRRFVRRVKKVLKRIIRGALPATAWS